MGEGEKLLNSSSLSSTSSGSDSDGVEEVIHGVELELDDLDDLDDKLDTGKQPVGLRHRRMGSKGKVSEKKEEDEEDYGTFVDLGASYDE